MVCPCARDRSMAAINIRSLGTGGLPARALIVASMGAIFAHASSISNTQMGIRILHHV